MQQTLAVLDGGRIGIAALSVGLAQAAFEEAVSYAKERTDLWASNCRAPGDCQWMLAEAATEIQAAR